MLAQLVRRQRPARIGQQPDKVFIRTGTIAADSACAARTYRPWSTRRRSGAREPSGLFLAWLAAFVVAAWICAASVVSFTSGWCRRNQPMISLRRNGSSSWLTHSASIDQTVMTLSLTISAQARHKSGQQLCLSSPSRA